MENLHCQRNLTVGLLSVCLVSKIQFRLSLYFELFDLQNFRFGSQKLHLAVKSNLGSLLWFHLSLSCQRNFFGQYTAKLSYLCKSCKGARIVLNPPYNTTTGGFAFFSYRYRRKN